MRDDRRGVEEEEEAKERGAERSYIEKGTAAGKRRRRAKKARLSATIRCEPRHGRMSDRVNNVPLSYPPAWVFGGEGLWGVSWHPVIIVGPRPADLGCAMYLRSPRLGSVRAFGGGCQPATRTALMDAMAIAARPARPPILFPCVYSRPCQGWAVSGLSAPDGDTCGAHGVYQLMSLLRPSRSRTMAS